MIRLRWRKFEFAPSVGMSLLTLLGVGLFVLLGNWQLQRADEKHSIEEAFRARLNEPCRRMLPTQDADQLQRYSRICLRGSYDQDRVVLVDNKLHKGVAGYHVLVPFLPRGASQAIWVNRGWVAGGADRNRLPRILPPREASRVEGVLTIPSTDGFRMGQVEPDGNWPLRVPYIDLEKINPQVEWSMLHYVVWLDPAIDDYYERDWKPVWSPPEKSRAYALQWFSFAAIALLLFLGLNTRKTDDGKD